MPDDRKEVISRRLKSLLADHVAGEWILRDIENEFEGAEITYKEDPTFSGGLRRTMVAGYYNGLDWSDPRDVRKFLTVLVPFLREGDRRLKADIESRLSWGAAYRESQPEPEHPLTRLIEELRRCGYEWRDGAVVPVSASARLADAKEFAEEFSLNHMAQHIQRIEKSIDADPSQAIGSAKELVETVAKTILTKRGIPFGTGDDILELGKAVFRALKQRPDDVPDAAKGAAIIKRTLSNLASVVQGVAELRGKYGTGHGQEGRTRGLRPRHARLVVGAAATLAYYWIDTDRETP